MKFKSRYDLKSWLGEVLNRELGDSVDEVGGESNESTGRCDIVIMFKNGDEATLSIKMIDEDGKDK